MQFHNPGQFVEHVAGCGPRCSKNNSKKVPIQQFIWVDKSDIIIEKNKNAKTTCAMDDVFWF